MAGPLGPAALDTQRCYSTRKVLIYLLKKKKKRKVRERGEREIKASSKYKVWYAEGIQG